MKTLVEMEIEVSNARISKASVLPNGVCKLELETEKGEPKRNQNKEIRILVEASKLSLTDEFMQHNPTTAREEQLKQELIKVIESGISDFYRPATDPSFKNKACTKIHCVAGRTPATGISYETWEEILKDSPWCLGTKSQYIAFLGVLIKLLVEDDWELSKAWNVVCNDSREVGYYFDFDKTTRRNQYRLEKTGSKGACGFFDLANTKKILAEDEYADGFWVAGGVCHSYSYISTLFSLTLEKSFIRTFDYAVGWLVLKNDK